MLRALRLTLLLPLLATPCTAQQTPYGIHIDGHPVTALATPGDRAVVLFFVASDCPISNRTFPEMQRLRQSFAPRHIRLWYVYPNTGEQPALVRQHQAAFDPQSDPSSDIILDPTGTLVRLTHARVTPEAAILIPSGDTWRTVYTGRIDDRYLHLGQQRPQVSLHFVERALNAVLAGTPVPPATGEPVGCAILNPAARSGQPQ